MNRCKILFAFFTIILTCEVNGFLIAQTQGIYEIGLPLVRNFPPKEYKGFSQNWNFVQDSRGVLYFANGDGVLEYDGVNWRTIKITNEYTVSSLAIDENDKIYVGSTSEFGYLAPSANGELQYVSLMNKMDVKDRKFNYILTIHVTKAGVFFIAGEKLFRWNGSNFKSWKLSKPCNFYKYGEQIVVWQKSKELKYVSNDTLIGIKSSHFFSEINIDNILPYNKKEILVVTRDSGLYLMSDPFLANNGQSPIIYRFYNQANSFLEHNQVLSSTVLKNGNFAFATMRGGTAIMDKDGSLIQVLDKKAGIQNETHNAVGEDQQNAIWLSLDNGITRVDISSPVSFWNDDMGLKGSVMSVTRFKNKIYVGTWQGLFYHDFSLANYYSGEDELNTDISQFKPVKGIRATTWDLMVLPNSKNREKDKLIIATSAGVFEADDYYATQVAKGTNIKLYHYIKDSSKIFAGTDEGVICISVNYAGDEIILKNEGIISDLKEKIISMAEDKEGRLWVSTEFGGVYLVEFKSWTGNKVHLSLEDKTTYKITHFDTTSGLPASYSNIYKIRDKLFFFSEEGVYYPSLKVVNGKDTGIEFVKFESPILDFFYKDIFINMLSEDQKGNLWLQFTDNNSGAKTLAIAKMKADKTYASSFIPFKPIPQMEVYSIFPEKSGVTWFGGDDGLIRYDGSSGFEYNLKFNALIRKVILERDSILFGGTFYTNVNDSGECYGLTAEQPENMKPQISYSYNSISFDYAATTYYSESSRRYKVFLEGFDKKWSEWSLESKKEYTNLPPGAYKFHVVAKNIFDIESSEAVYEFEILPPWYRTWIAYIIYVILFLYLIRVVLKYSNKRLREAKLKLEDMVQERTTEIINQKKELEQEKEKSDKLLLNILPFRIAEELKVSGQAKTKYFDSVTVMFSDFKDFTVIAQQLEPQELIAELNRCFVFFDDVCVRHNIEKIKTVGDSYMCAGGVPIKNQTHPVDIVLAAFEIRDFISRLKKEQSEKGRTLWKIRIGIHTGHIISGVVGKKKFAYDIWGDTVNTASRMEQTSMPNKINISGETYELIKEFFDCTYRGKIPAKNKGEIDMYFAERIKKDLCVDDEGRIPNQKFWELYERLKTEE